MRWFKRILIVYVLAEVWSYIRYLKHRIRLSSYSSPLSPSYFAAGGRQKWTMWFAERFVRESKRDPRALLDLVSCAFWKRDPRELCRENVKDMLSMLATGMEEHQGPAHPSDSVRVEALVKEVKKGRKKNWEQSNAENPSLTIATLSLSGGWSHGSGLCARPQARSGSRCLLA